ALLITGGTGALGRVVVAWLEREYRCVLLYHSTVPAGREGVRADLGDEASVRAAMAQVGPFYGLVHLAGGYAGGRVSETTREGWEGMIALNLTSSFVVIHDALAHMRRDEPGRIVAISSAATRTRLASAAAYAVPKTGPNALL